MNTIIEMIVGNLVREGINKHRARELAVHFVKQCNYTNGYCTGRTDLLAEQKAAQPKPRTGDCLLTGVCASEGHKIQKACDFEQPVAWMYDIARYGPTDLRGQQWRPAISRTKPNIHDSLVRDLTPLYTSSQPTLHDTNWKDMYEKQKRKADMWVSKYEADIGPVEKAGPVTAQQEPVAIVKVLPMGHGQADMHWAELQHVPEGTPLYTRPQAREPLTDEQIEKMRHLIDWTAGWSYSRFARAIEAAHKIYPKNSDCHGPDWTDRDGEYLK